MAVLRYKNGKVHFKNTSNQLWLGILNSIKGKRAKVLVSGILGKSLRKQG